MSEIRYKKILAPTDGSEYSSLAGEHAAYLAALSGGTVIALNIVNDDMAFYSGIHYAESMLELEKAGKSAIKAIASICATKGVPCEEVIVKGRPWETIVRYAQEAGVDCIVIGSLGMSAIERVLVGSTSDKVLRHARCPVLLVRQR